MRRLNAETIARVYLIIVLLLAVLVSSLFQVGLALFLLGIQLFLVYKPLKSSLNLVLVVSSLVLAPLALEALAGPFFAVLLVVPGLVLLDSNLKVFAASQTFAFSKVGRNASGVLKTLVTGLLTILLVSILAWNLTLLLAVSVLLGYLAIVLAYTYRVIPIAPLHYSKTWSRLVAGESDSKVINIKGKARASIRISLQPTVSWSKVEPSSFTLPVDSAAGVTLRFVPQLAGPSCVQVRACVIDSRGLLFTGQVLEPVDLHVIPRARFAQWLANKFLEQTSAGAGMAITVPRPSSRNARRGVEFYGSRPYQPGDRWKDLDWKHSYMLNELITKEYAGGQDQNTILVADLTAKDAEAADKLAYNFVMSALTLATEALPSALAVYNHDEVLAATSPMNPRETLKKALGLTEKIIIFEPKEKVLQPTEMRRLKRSIGQLSGVQSESAQKLSEVLKFEFEANQQAAKDQPASEALALVTGNMQGPALITVVSAMTDDSDALLLTLERLKEKGYSAVMVA